MCKTWLYRKINYSLILDIPCAYIMCYPPPWMGLDLLSTFVLTPLQLWFSSKGDPDFFVEDVE